MTCAPAVARAPRSSPGRLVASPGRRVADGLWLVRGGLPRRTINVFLIEDGDGVTAFDAGIRGMGGALVTTAAPLGGIARVVLSHAHPDHRGGAPAIAAPALCHRDERPDVEGGGGTSYFDYRRARSPLARMRMVALMRLVDAGPVAVAGTLDEGDDVAGFRVVHLPGHAPGLIALWRERDGLVLASDAFGTHSSGAPLLPHPAYSHDPEGARASLLTLAALAPRTAWPAHGDPLTGDVSAALRRVARA